jgi:hypothetical protein
LLPCPAGSVFGTPELDDEFVIAKFNVVDVEAEELGAPEGAGEVY